MTSHQTIYVDGAWSSANGNGSVQVTNASTEEIISSIPAGSATDACLVKLAGRWSTLRPASPIHLRIRVC